MFFAVNLPFYWLGWRRMGARFTLKTFAAVALLSSITGFCVGCEAYRLFDAFGAVQYVAAGDDVDHPLVLVQIELAGLLFEPADEPDCNRQVPAAVQERDLCVVRRDVATRDADGHPTAANATGLHGFGDRIGGGFAGHHDPPLEAVARRLPHG